MKHVKKLKVLLEDIFIYLQRKYGNHKDFYVTVRGQAGKAVELTLPNHQPSWSKPSVVLTSDGHGGSILLLSMCCPETGYNENFNGVILELHSSFNGTNQFWLCPTDVFDGLGRILVFNEEDHVQNELRLELLKKTHKLFYSKEYDTKRYKVETLVHSEE